MAGDRDGNRFVDSVRRRQQRQQSDRSNTVGTAREHRGFLRCDHHRIIGLFCEFAVSRARLPRDYYSDWCGGPGATHSPCARCPFGHSLRYGLWPDAQLSELLVERSDGTRRYAWCIGQSQRCQWRTVDHRHPQRHIPDAIGIELQCSKPSTRADQTMPAADRNGYCTGSMSVVTVS